MLIAKIYINSDKIDEIHIQNVGKTIPDWPMNDAHNYKIRKPKGFDRVIVHHRGDGYEPLLLAALEEIVKAKED